METQITLSLVALSHVFGREESTATDPVVEVFTKPICELHPERKLLLTAYPVNCISEASFPIITTHSKASLAFITSYLNLKKNKDRHF